ncbi:MAG: hypothetical protein VXY42_02205 [Candidatus Thermoplasmatota archaeon]|nr:hypothetical protein [Candidatus Thermoplasmatota archaeon]
MKKIAVVGLGSVGSSVLSGMSKHHSCVGYDIDGRGDWEDVLSSDFAFVCVPTNAGHDDCLDVSIVHEVINRLNRTGYDGTIVVKSTLQPYTMEALHKEFPSQKICYMPEYLREKNALEWFENPDRLVITEPSEIAKSVLDLFTWVNDAVPRIIMTCIEAEIAKLAHNAYIATKVTFTCEIERLCILHNARARKVMNSIWVDRRIGNMAHLEPGLGGFDGKCVPKDTFALAKFDTERNSLLHILKSRGLEDNVRRHHHHAEKLAAALKQKKNSFPSSAFSILASLFMSVITYGLIAGTVILAVIGAGTIGWESTSQLVGETKFLDGNVTLSEGDVVFVSEIVFDSTGVYTTSSHQCYSNYEGGSDCSTTYHDHIKYNWNEYWFYSTNNGLNTCLTDPCDLIGEVQESGIIEVIDWRHANE